MGKTIGVVLALKDKCSPQLKKVADSMGITEKEAKKLHKQAKDLSKELGNGFKKASAVCAAAIGAVAVATQQLVSHTMQAGDRVDKMSQKIGMSRQSFQEWDYIMSQNGSSVDTLQMGYKKLASQMDGVRKGSKESTQLFNKLGVSVKDNNGQLRSQEAVFNDTVRALQRIKNPSEKAIMANKLFGKSALELMPLLNQTADSTDNLRKKANDLGMVMSDEAVDASVKLTDTMDTIKRSMGGLTLSIGASFLPIIQEFSDKFIENMPQIKQAVTPVIEGLIGTLKFLSEHMELVIGVCTALASTFVAFNVINGVIKTITTLQKVIQLVTAAQGIWNAVMLMNPIGAIAVGVGLLIGAVVMLVRNWDTVKAAFVSFYETIQPALSTVGKYIKIAFAFTPIGMFINGIKLLIQNWDKVTETVKKAIDTVKQFIGLKPGKKTVEVETKTTNSGDSEKPKKHALGTTYSTGGPAIVGEYGPELLNLNKGDTVTPAPKTQQILQSGQNNRPIEIHIHGNVYGIDDLVGIVKDRLAIELNTALATT